MESRTLRKLLILILLAVGFKSSAQVGVAAADTSLRATVNGVQRVWKNFEYYKTAFGLYYNKAQSDARYAPIFGTGYIQNQNASAQAANAWINGRFQSLDARFGTASTYSSLSQFGLSYMSGAVGLSWAGGNQNITYNATSHDFYNQGSTLQYLHLGDGTNSAFSFAPNFQVQKTPTLPNDVFRKADGDLKANISGQVFTGAISATNLSGTNTGDQDISGKENTSNKVTTLTGANNTTYPTSLAVQTAITANVPNYPVRSVNGRTGDVVNLAEASALTTETSRATTAETTLQQNINKAVSYTIDINGVAGQNFVVDSRLIAMLPTQVFKGTFYSINTTASDPLKNVTFDPATGRITFPENMVSGEVIKVTYAGSGNTAYVPGSIAKQADVDYLTNKLGLFVDTYGDLSLTYPSTANTAFTFFNTPVVSRTGKVTSLSFLSGALADASIKASIVQYRGSTLIKTISNLTVVANSTNTYTVDIDVLPGDFIGVNSPSIKFASGVMPGKIYYINAPPVTPISNSYAAILYTVEVNPNIVTKVDALTSKTVAYDQTFAAYDDKLQVINPVYGDLSYTFGSASYSGFNIFNNTPVLQDGKVIRFKALTSANTNAGNTLNILQSRAGTIIKTVTIPVTANATIDQAVDIDVLTGDYIGVSGATSQVKWAQGTAIGASIYSAPPTVPPQATIANNAMAYTFEVQKTASIVSKMTLVTTKAAYTAKLVDTTFSKLYGNLALSFVSPNNTDAVLLHSLPTEDYGYIDYINLKTGTGTTGTNIEFYQYRLISGLMSRIATYSTTFIPSSNIIINPRFKVNKGDYIGFRLYGTSFYLLTGQSPAGFILVNTSTGTYSTTVGSLLSMEFRVKTTALTEAIRSIPTKSAIPIIFPPKIYTTFNDITSTGLAVPIRNYSANIYLDHMLDGLKEEPRINFKELKDKYTFYSPLTRQFLASTIVANNGVDIYKPTIPLSITGGDFTDRDISIQQFSTKASKSSAKSIFLLPIGDSITYGQGAAFFSDPTNYLSYSVLTKGMFELDKIDNGGTGYTFLSLGHYKRTSKINYLGVDRTIVACHEGVQGVKTSYYTENAGNPFWDAANSRFSIAAYLSKYRTLDDNGVRLDPSSPLKGTLVTDVTAFDVCRPTHITLATGTNDMEGGTVYTNRIQGWINTIKAEYAANGWGDVYISVALPDGGGSYFPSLHPNFDKSAWIWNMPISENYHSNAYQQTKSWLEHISGTDEDASKVYYLPFYFVAPTAESLSVREVSPFNADGNPFARDLRMFTQYSDGNLPAVHVNPNAHASWAQQLYSWLKYTSTP